MQSNIARGTFWLLASNFIFFLAGYFIYFALGKFLLSPSQFGVYSIIISLATFITLILVPGMHQAVSKFVSESPKSAELVKSRAFAIQVAISLTIFSFYLALAPQIASLLNDSSLTFFIQISSILILVHPFYAVFDGYLNGMKKFVLYSKLQALYAFFKVVAVVGLVALGFGVLGAVLGFILSSVVGFFFYFYYAKGLKYAKGNFDTRRFLYFALPITVFTIMNNLFSRVDLYAVKALSPQALSNHLAGLYSAAQTIAGIPPLAVATFAFVLFPLISNSMHLKEEKKTRAYLRESIRYSLMALAPLTAIIAANASQLLLLLYTAAYSSASGALSWLVIGMFMFALTFIFTTIITSSGKPLVSMAIGTIAVIAELALSLMLVPLYSLEGAALAVLFSMSFAAVVSGAYIVKRFGWFISLRSSFRILLAGALTAFASQFWQVAGIILLAKIAALLAFYAAMLFILREITPTDIRLFRGVFVK